ncbi:hypothetical protein GCK72_024703 [Caenorhabditis remanei]|uniref:Uncharacterized protein n=1 Tax=Caenorhabditis remanei TaxID=31234 RepID=A0A6A5FZZ0_CAERE|nr:hypothetical protein GCK72_024703 [Caenorhabditis remanei]KAF1748236.1 hypothetical protein GCK72_024703 [Caenorhabditis remanei]
MVWLMVFQIFLFVVLLIALGVVYFVFLWHSASISYNPCSFNVYKDDYRRFLLRFALPHSIGQIVFALFQVIVKPFWKGLFCHASGSLQVLSMGFAIFYYHRLVHNYKYRFLECQNRGHMDFKKPFFLELTSFCVYVLIFAYSSVLFVAEIQFPYGIFAEPFIDPNVGWDIFEFTGMQRFLTVAGSCLLFVNLGRIIKNSYNIRRWEDDLEECNHFFFRKYVSKNIEPHFINDFILLYIPTQYLLINGFPGFRLNGFDVLAKWLISVHPIGFIIIYMLQIKAATLRSNKDEMECRCCVCQKKDLERRTSKGYCRSLGLKVMGSCGGEDNGMEEEGEGDRVELGGEDIAAGEGGAATNAHEHPTETTPAMHTDQIRVSEDL